MVVNASKTKALLVTGKRLANKMLNSELNVTVSRDVM